MSNRYDSIFLDGFSSIFSSIFIWLPLFILVIFIILRNNDSKNSVRVFTALILSLSITYISTKFIISSCTNVAIAFCLATFLVWLFHYTRITYLSLIIVSIYSFTYIIYNGMTNLTDFLTGILTGTVISTFIYIFYKVLSRIKYKFHWNKSTNEYTRNGYLISDLEWIFGMVYTLSLISVFYAIVT